MTTLEANAITVVSLWPGSLASAGAYRREVGIAAKPLAWLIASSTALR